MPDLAELRERIAWLAAGYPRPRQVGEMKVFSTTRTTAPLGNVAEPVVSLVAQGAKRSTLGSRAFDYGAGQFVVITVDLPLTSHITAASDHEPFLGCSLPLDPPTIAGLLLESRLPARTALDGPAISVSDAAPDLIDAFVRLLKLVGSPQDARVLAPAVRREIHWRLLTGPHGGLVRQVGLADGRVAVVARAIAWIKGHYDEVIRVEDLAAEVGLSVSSLNRHFRAATSMSPVQYQKQIRLQRARIRLLANPGDVAGAGHAVGYTSASQFNREYRRLFGAPPGEDAARLQDSRLVVE
ncbi:MAG: AraC-type DNA-binding protein [Actinomycetia bacterium]|nr:AraC-type DNA-binding protein [Actinomycetes bacterium]